MHERGRGIKDTPPLFRHTSRTITPDARPFTPHTWKLMRATHPSSAPSLQALDVGDVLLVLAASHWRWSKSVVCPSLMCRAPTSPDSAWVISRHPLGSSSSWHALHNLIVLSIGDSCRSLRGSPCCGCFFSDILTPVLRRALSFCDKTEPRTRAEYEKIQKCQKQKKMQNTKQTKNTKLCEKSARLRQFFFRILQGVGAYVFRFCFFEFCRVSGWCLPILRIL